MTNQYAPSNWIHVRTFAVQPLIVLLFPSVKVNFEQASNHLGNSCDAHQTRIHQIGALQLHANLKTSGRYVSLEQTFISWLAACVDQILVPAEDSVLVATRRCEYDFVFVAKAGREDTWRAFMVAEPVNS